MLAEQFGGKVPSTIDELQRLPGVGRKTANVIASVVYNQPAFAVDTHVYRVSRRIGLVPLTAKTPLAVEKELMRHVPKTLVPHAHHWLILHGRYVCLARTPKCLECGISSVCAFWQKKQRQAP
jgi:endonuclease-3